MVAPCDERRASGKILCSSQQPATCSKAVWWFVFSLEIICASAGRFILLAPQQIGIGATWWQSFVHDWTVANWYVMSRQLISSIFAPLLFIVNLFFLWQIMYIYTIVTIPCGNFPNYAFLCRCRVLHGWWTSMICFIPVSFCVYKAFYFCLRLVMPVCKRDIFDFVSSFLWYYEFHDFFGFSKN